MQHDAIVTRNRRHAGMPFVKRCTTYWIVAHEDPDNESDVYLLTLSSLSTCALAGSRTTGTGCGYRPAYSEATNE